MKKSAASFEKKAVYAMAPLFVLAGVHLASAMTLDRVIEYKGTEFASDKIGAGLGGYKIALISDCHAIPGEKLREIVRRLNKEEIDLALLGGDISHRFRCLRNLRILSELHTQDGIFGVAGNHDSRIRLQAVMKGLGMGFLDNEGLPVRENLYLAGVREMKWDRPDVAKALSGAKPRDFVILLSHMPDVVMAQDCSKADIVLCGHTHGGQITLLGKWSPAMALLGHTSRFGQRFRSGWAKDPNGADIFVGNGIGSHKYIPRIFARPQVICLTLL